jgi:hypothetical protein
MIAALLVAAPAAAGGAQVQSEGDWGIEAMPNGCMVQVTSPRGTMLSVWGFAGEAKLGFLLQNRGWNDLRDGQRYDLQVEFVGQRSLPVEATARREIDADGPGFFFSVEPGRAGGDGFLDAFASARGMAINQEGKTVDTLPLAGSRGAMAALARCLSDRWGNGASAPAREAEAEAPDEEAPATI